MESITGKKVIEKIKLSECLPSGTLYYKDQELGNQHDAIDKFMEKIGYPREIFTYTFEKIAEHDFIEHFFLVILSKENKNG